MREVQIVGSGAIGSLFGYFLLKSGVDIVFIARGSRYKQLKQGLKIAGIENFFEKVEVYDKPVRSWLTLVCVKSYDTNYVAESIRGKTDIAMSIQNGIGNEDVLSLHVPKVIGGVTSYAANVSGDVVIYAGEGKTWLGNWKNCENEVYDVAEMLSRGGMNVEITDKIAEMKWKKVAINAVINPLTAIMKIRNGEVLKLWNTVKLVCMECKAVLEKMGISMDVEKEVMNVVKSTAENKSSMLQDVEKGKKTEIDAITGKILEVGKKYGLDVRVNESLYWIVKYLEGDR